MSRFFYKKLPLAPREPGASSNGENPIRREKLCNGNITMDGRGVSRGFYRELYTQLPMENYQHTWERGVIHGIPKLESSFNEPNLTRFRQYDFVKPSGICPGRDEEHRYICLKAPFQPFIQARAIGRVVEERGVRIKGKRFVLGYWKFLCPLFTMSALRLHYAN